MGQNGPSAFLKISKIARVIYLKNCPNRTRGCWLITPNQKALLIFFSETNVFQITPPTVHCWLQSCDYYHNQLLFLLFIIPTNTNWVVILNYRYNWSCPLWGWNTFINLLIYRTVYFMYNFIFYCIGNATPKQYLKLDSWKNQ